MRFSMTSYLVVLRFAIGGVAAAKWPLCSWIGASVMPATFVVNALTWPKSDIVFLYKLGEHYHLTTKQR